MQPAEVDKVENLWDPKLKIQNLEEIKGGRDEKWHTIKLGDPDPIVIFKRRLKGSFYENMELKDFPRDVQVSHSVRLTCLICSHFCLTRDKFSLKFTFISRLIKINEVCSINSLFGR